MINHKGQAFVETLWLAVLLLTSFFYIIRLGLFMHQNIVISELVEEALLCTIQKKLDCEKKMKAQLLELKYSNIYLQIYADRNIATLILKATSAWGRTLEKESELSIDLSA